MTFQRPAQYCQGLIFLRTNRIRQKATAIVLLGVGEQDEFTRILKTVTTHLAISNSGLVLAVKEIPDCKV